MTTRKTSFLEESAVLAVLAIFNTVYLYHALQLGSLIKYGIPSAAFLPVVLSGLMYVGIAIALVVQWRKRQPHGPGGAALLRVYAKPALAALLTAAYVYAFARLGFEAATACYVFLLLWMFGFRETDPAAKRLALLAPTAIAITLVVYAFFFMGFNVQLPSTRDLL